MAKEDNLYIQLSTPEQLSLFRFFAPVRGTFAEKSPDFSPVGSVSASAAQRSPPETRAPKTLFAEIDKQAETTLLAHSGKLTLPIRGVRCALSTSRDRFSAGQGKLSTRTVVRRHAGRALKIDFLSNNSIKARKLKRPIDKHAATVYNVYI